MTKRSASVYRKQIQRLNARLENLSMPRHTSLKDVRTRLLNKRADALINYIRALKVPQISTMRLKTLVKEV